MTFKLTAAELQVIVDTLARSRVIQGWSSSVIGGSFDEQTRKRVQDKIEIILNSVSVEIVVEPEAKIK